MEMVGPKRMRLCSGQDGGNDVVATGRWESLNPEVLALVFVRIPADELVRVVSLVCKSWLAAVAGPYCWKEIDVEEWCRRSRRPDWIDSAVRKLVRRSRGDFGLLAAFKLGNAGFSFAANFGRCLKELRIPMSNVTDNTVEKHAESLTKVKVLDISNCVKITSKGLEAFGKHCKCLVQLKRNMPPPELGMPTAGVALKADDSEAIVIADNMPGLHHLELGFGRFGNHGLNAILTSCKLLSNLDIQGCWNVEFDADLEDKCEQIELFKDPWVDDDYENCGYSDDDGEELPFSESE
ncbi:F-box protein FBW2-like [Malania oleifera]|uniref:F-box protein FBW2-like n=1 Tax=Malania oleifera TaxID=397392 RepID=UPI0025AE27B2|nr:F-box protein FBW2-like [Malania oleifera]